MKRLYDWTKNRMDDCREDDSEANELIARIQYAMQQHFFGTLAEKYFDDMNNDVQFSGKRHVSKSIEGFNQLPKVFTKDDVIRVFHYDKPRAADKKIERLKADNFIERIAEGDDFGKYRKLQTMIA